MKTLIAILIVLYLSVNTAKWYDQQTLKYLQQLDYDIAMLEQTISPLDIAWQQAITALAGRQKGIMIDMSRCPFQKLNAWRDKGLCKTWWIIKMKPLYKGIIYR